MSYEIIKQIIEYYINLLNVEIPEAKIALAKNILDEIAIKSDTLILKKDGNEFMYSNKMIKLELLRFFIIYQAYINLPLQNINARIKSRYNDLYDKVVKSSSFSTLFNVIDDNIELLKEFFILYSFCEEELDEIYRVCQAEVNNTQMKKALLLVKKIDISDFSQQKGNRVCTITF